MRNLGSTLALVGSPLAVLLLGWGCAVPPPGDGELDGEEPTAEQDEAVGSGTVEQAMASSCSTATIKPLSQQIIDEMRCMDPDSLAEVPQASNLSLAAGVFPYLSLPARNAFVAALGKKPGTTMTVNSMFRTVAQQYMVRRWLEQGRCGIQAAAQPGNSNHESGLAVDIASNATWRSTLEGQGFDWFGSGDAPHFDYEGPGAVSQKGVDVEAFQRLWNRNHPNDEISEDGAWGPQTRARVKSAPAAGFATGAVCGVEPDPEPTPDPSGWSCEDFATPAEFSCAPDGNGRGKCVSEQLSFESCDSGCLIQTGNDVCMGTSSSWSCSGTTGKTKMQNGNYIATAFGCGIAADGTLTSDAGDNCIPACFNALKQNGTCGAGMSGPQCERHINWYAADRDRFSCGARLRVTNPSNGKSAVIMVIDAGPACWVENEVDTGVLDMSYRTTEHLFGGAVGFDDGKGVHVVEVAADTPLGPVL